MSGSRGPLSDAVIGRYRVGPLLGRGGMGEVYRADDPNLQRAVVLKVLPESLVGEPDRLDRFVHEARAASALNHPHVVSIYEIGEHRFEDGRRPVHYIAMELVHGATLRELIDARRLDLRRTLDLAVQIADALAAAHAAGIVHRDLKPENLMVAEGGYAKVLDFGLAKLRTPVPETAADGLTVTAPTSPGVVLGTVGYMSPEQAQGLPADARSDVFSFGCVLYEAATGTKAFRGSSAVDTLHKIISEPPPPVSTVAPAIPPELQRIIRKCLAKSPDERYQSMRDVALDLRELRREVDSGVTSTSAGASLPPRAARRWIGLAAVAVGAAAVAFGLWSRGSTVRDGTPPASLSIERITASSIVIDASISPDGKYLAYVESLGGQQKLFVRQVDGSQPLHLLSPAGAFWGIAFSNDATSIYYALKGAPQPQGILYAIPILGGQPRELLQRIDSSVTFSPDGRRLAYYRIDADDGTSALVVAGVDGSSPRVLAKLQGPDSFAPAFYTAPSWSPDGLRIAAAIRNRATGDARVVTVDLASGAIDDLSERFAEATFTRWLPDGSGIVMVARAFGAFGTGNGGQLWLQPYPSGQARRITSDIIEYRTVSMTADGGSLVTVGFEATGRLSILSLADGVERRLPSERYDGALGLDWTSDGTRVFFTRIVRTDLQIWSMKADGTESREVVRNVRSGGFAVSPDGQTLVFAGERDGTMGLWAVSSDGLRPRRIGGPADSRSIRFSPDGQWIYFTSALEGAGSTYRVSIGGGEPRLVARDLQRAVVSPDGRLLAGLRRDRQTAESSLVVVDAQDGAVRATHGQFDFPGGTGGLEWMPDGKALVFTTVERANLWKLSTETPGPLEQVTQFPELWVIRFRLSSDGKAALLSRGAGVRDAFLLRNFR